MEVQNIVIIFWAWLCGFVIGGLFSLIIGLYLYSQPKKAKKS